MRLPAEKRIQAFADILAPFAWRMGFDRRDLRLAEFLLRLASDPGSLARIPDVERESSIALILQSPLLLRAARFIVLVSDAAETEGAWVWE